MNDLSLMKQKSSHPWMKHFNHSNLSRELTCSWDTHLWRATRSACMCSRSRHTWKSKPTRWRTRPTLPQSASAVCFSSTALRHWSFVCTPRRTRSRSRPTASAGTYGWFWTGPVRSVLNSPAAFSILYIRPWFANQNNANTTTDSLNWHACFVAAPAQWVSTECEHANTINHATTTTIRLATAIQAMQHVWSQAAARWNTESIVHCVGELIGHWRPMTTTRQASKCGDLESCPLSV